MLPIEPNLCPLMAVSIAETLKRAKGTISLAQAKYA